MLRRFWQAIGVALILGITAVGWRGFDARRYETALREAKAELDAGRSVEAGRRLARMANRWPGRGEVDYLLGTCELALGRPEAADTAWGRVAEGSEYAGRAGLARARLALGRRRLSLVEQILGAGPIGDGPAAEESVQALARAYTIEGRFEDARELLRSGRGRGGDRVDRLRQLDRLESPEPMPAPEALATLTQGYQTAGDDDRVWLGLANLATRSGDLVEAGRWLAMCERRHHRDRAVWRARVAWAMASDKPAVASRCVHEPPAGPVEGSEVLALQAWFARRDGRPDRERAALLGLLARHPGDAAALQQLADLEAREGHADRAAEALARKAEVDRARLDYARRIGGPDPAADAPGLARLAEASGRPHEARCWWELARERDPASAPAREALARLDRPGPAPPAAPTLEELQSEAPPPEPRRTFPFLASPTQPTR